MIMNLENGALELAITEQYLMLMEIKLLFLKSVIEKIFINVEPFI